MKANRLLALAVAFCLLLSCGQALAQEGNVYTLTLVVRPAGAGDILVDGVAPDYYPYSLTLNQDQLKTYTAVPKPPYASFTTWTNAVLSKLNPLADQTFNADRTLVANFDSRLTVISGQVWDDKNRDGVRDLDTEPLLTGWTVGLYRASDNALMVQDKTFSDPQVTGINYSLLAPEAGTYYVKFTCEPNWVPIPKGPHSDADPETGITANAAVTLDGPDVTFNAGFSVYPKVNTPDQVKTNFDANRDLVVIDVRENAEYCTGHIPCVRNIPWNSGILQANVAMLASDIGLNAVVVVVSNTGVRSARAAQFLADYGFTNVTNMSPGMLGTGHNDGWRWASIKCTDPYPVANAGQDGTVAEGSTYTLSTSGSSTVYIYQYMWTQIGPIGGPQVTLSNPYSYSPTFVAPPVAEPVTLTFQLSVLPFNRECGAVLDTVKIVVTDNGIINYPADVTSFYSYNGFPLGVKVNSGGGLCRLIALDNHDYTITTGTPPNGMPYGILDVGFVADTFGGTMSVTFYFPTAQPSYYTWFKLQGDGWYTYTDHAVWNQAYTELTIELVDGGAGDDTDTDYIILDPGGLGFFTPNTPPNPGPVGPQTTRGDDSGTSRGCFLDTLLGR